MKTVLTAVVVFCFAACAAAWCAVVDRRRSPVRGKASFYGEAYRGHRMANGERFDPQARTCAVWQWPLGAVLCVREVLPRGVKRPARWVYVTVTDRGPALALGRIIDLSQRAFAELSPIGRGVIEVEIEEVEL
ncbi:MAG: hypothetical protein RLZZ15_166 [Verrucomicrobiota bacterium]|jgi:rare lipoprotein A